MHFDTSIRNAVLITVFFLPAYASPCGQKKSEPAGLREMLLTDQGLLAIDSPKGWIRTKGVGLAYFVPASEPSDRPGVWIYISSAPIGSNAEAKDLKGYIKSDIAAFKARFSVGLVREEEAIRLPYARVQAPVYTFQSGEQHNAVEQVVYVGESNRVLTLVLSALDKPKFQKALATFRDFAKSYRGSITPSSGPN
jgi:hypothetical protein